MAGEQRIKLDMEISDLKKHIKEGYQKLEEMSNKFKDLNKQLNDRTVDDLGQRLAKALEKPDKQIDKLKEKLNKLQNQYAKYQKQYDKAIASGDKEGARMAKGNMADIDAQDLKISEQINKLEEEKQRILEKTKEDYLNETEAIKSQAKEVQQQFDALDKIVENDSQTLLKLESPFAKIKATLEDIKNSAVKGLKGAVDGLFKKDPTAGLQKGMKSVLGTSKRFAMSLLGAYSAYSLISKAVNQIKENNEQLANTMNTLWNGLVSLVEPVVNALVNAFATALNYILKIASVISGINILGKLKQANKKANSKKSGSGGNSNNLYSFDTSETLQKNSGSGSSVNEGLLKEVELNDKLKGYAEKLKTIWNNIAKTGENLVARIKEGWEYMNSGERILTVLDNLANAFLDDLIEITQATLDWSETINFGPLFDSVASVMESFEPILEKVGDLFVWLWKECVLPLASYIIEELVPAVNNVLAPAFDVISSALDALGSLLNLVWTTYLKPVIEYIGGLAIVALQAFADLISNNKDKWQELMEKLAVVFDYCTQEFFPIMELYVNTAFEAVKLIIESLAKLIEWLVGWAIEYFSGLIDFLTGVFTGDWDLCFKGLEQMLNIFGDSASGVVDGMKRTFSGLIDFLIGVFTGDWNTAWKGLAEIFCGIWDTMVSAVEGVTNGIIEAINWLIRKINQISITIPNKKIFGDFAGTTIGFNIDEIAKVNLSGFKVPKLAQGAIIPPNREFLAMLGDQTRGRNIEAPEELIREIVSEESGNQEINIVANGTMSQLIKLLRLELQKEDKRVGASLVVGG